MPIIYTLASRGLQVLAEYTSAAHSGNFSSITRVLLKKIPAEDGKLSYVYDQYIFHYVVSRGMTYLCMTDQNYSKILSFQFLAEVESEFLRLYGSRWQTAVAYSFNGDFSKVLSRLVQEYSNKRQEDEKLTMIRGQVEDIRGIMSRNIELVLERGEKIELLVEKSELMEQHAMKFSKQSTKLKRKFCCKNAKMTILLILVFLAILYFILCAACGGMKLPKCVK